MLWLLALRKIATSDNRVEVHFNRRFVDILSANKRLIMRLINTPLKAVIAKACNADKLTVTKETKPVILPSSKHSADNYVTSHCFNRFACLSEHMHTQE